MSNELRVWQHEPADDVQVAALRMPGLGHAIAEHRGRDCSWRAHGIRLLATHDVGLINSHHFRDIRTAEFSGWSQSRSHYCPTGKWTEWVELARRILAVDAAISSGERTDG